MELVIYIFHYKFEVAGDINYYIHIIAMSRGTVTCTSLSVALYQYVNSNYVGLSPTFTATLA